MGNGCVRRRLRRAPDLPPLPLELDAPLHDLRDTLARRTRGDLRLDTLTRGLYATDGSMYQKMPLGVFFPRHADDVQALVEETRRLGLPVLPRGGGSSLAGQAVNAAVVVDFCRHMGEIVEIDPERRIATVQPGLVLDTLSRALAPHGLMVGPDPASSSRATLGGMAGNNSTGTHSIWFGNMLHHVAAMRVLLDDGSDALFTDTPDDVWAQRLKSPGREGDVYRGLDALVRSRSEIIRRETARHWRRNSGYRLEQLLGKDAGPFAGGPGGGVQPVRNLARLLCGSEGTLAITTELDVQLVEKPRHTALGVAHFTDLDAALRAVPTMLETGPSAIELFDDYAVRAARNSPGFGMRMDWVEGEPGAVLMTEYFCDSPAEGQEKLDALRRRLGDAPGYYHLFASVDPVQIARVFSVRKEGLGIIMSNRGDLKPIAFIEDASVPPEHLADYIAALKQVLKETDTPVALYAHASAGCLHVRPFINLKDAAQVEKMARIAQASMELVRQYGGTVSSEHADGLARSWLNPGLLGPDLYAANVEVKRLFDPDNRFNPGNVVEAGPMTGPLRVGPGEALSHPPTRFDWSKEGGFGAAVEQCNGNGACRKLDTGVMCPTYMVTLEEQHTTRGRANALRLAMTGHLPGGITSPDVAAALDLCVQCKACKTECPSNVDMGRMKSEWLAMQHAEKRPSLRTRLLAQQPQIARRLPRALRGIASWGSRNALFRARLARLGVVSTRALPPFARQTFTEWFAAQTWRRESLPGKPEVVLFADTFNNYNHPEVAMAAAQVLDRLGYRVLASSEKACCGRTLLSKGFIEAARREAKNALSHLVEHAEVGRVVVGLEPSCLLTFGDEFRTLLPGDPQVETLARQSLLFEDFVAREAEAGRIDAAAFASGEKVLLHGHCHQKALVGTAGARAALALAGYDVTVLDTACCGMAGSFGYEAEHYETSVKMAERRLLPAVRARGEAHVAAPGTSCRAQITDLSDAAPLHPAQLLLQALR